MEKIEFINAIAKSAKTVCNERGYGYAQYATCCAQAACESNYGRSSLMANANAFFGVKASKSWVTAAKYGGKVYNSKTKECYDGSTYTSITACFRAYKTLDDSVRDYFDLLEGKRYKASLSATTLTDAIRIIHDAGYATSPTYKATIASFYNSIKQAIDNVWGSVYNNIEAKTTYPTIKNGTCGKSAYVKLLQQLLNKHSYGLVVDGIWGLKTGTAVRHYQSNHSLTCDGIVGPKTWQSLTEV